MQAERESVDILRQAKRERRAGYATVIGLPSVTLGVFYGLGTLGTYLTNDASDSYLSVGIAFLLSDGFSCIRDEMRNAFDRISYASEMIEDFNSHRV